MRAEDVKWIGRGLACASDMVLENLHIPTTAIRPAVSTSTGLRARAQDDLTLRLQDVVKRSCELRAEIEDKPGRKRKADGGGGGVRRGKEGEEGEGEGEGEGEEGEGEGKGDSAVCAPVCAQARDGLDFDTVMLKALPPRCNLVRTGPPMDLRRSCRLTPGVLARWARLQVEVFNLVHPTLARHVTGSPKISLPAGVTQRRSVITKLKGKDGRIRGFLLGKRVDYSARSVISPSSTLPVNAVGVPRSIACTLTIPIRCTSKNMRQLRACVLKGAGVVGGAATVIDVSGRLISLEAVSDLEAVDVRPGVVVERHLNDDDIVIFNRQPTLHRLGMLGHVVKIVEGDTFQLALPVTTTTARSFDGDEMNAHVTQSPAATAELSILMSVAANAVNPKTTRCAFGLVQDALLGVNLLTARRANPPLFSAERRVGSRVWCGGATWTRWGGSARTWRWRSAWPTCPRRP